MASENGDLGAGVDPSHEAGRRSPEAVLAPWLPVRHAFLTRRGGVSRGLHASLNCGRGSEDDPAAVERNRALAAGAVGVPPDALVTLRQVHSARALVVREAGAPARADAAVTDRAGLALGVLSADCAPVLLADPEAGVIGAAHAGWRGALGGILDAAVEAMATLGAEPGRIAAAVGPCIGPDAYEVGAEFEERFLAEDPASGRFFRSGGPRPRFDLPGYVRHRLAAAGVGRAEWTGHCTPRGRGAVLLLPAEPPAGRARLRPAPLGDPALTTSNRKFRIKS